MRFPPCKQKRAPLKLSLENYSDTSSHYADVNVQNPSHAMHKAAKVTRMTLRTNCGKLDPSSYGNLARFCHY
jgi:hypothetical protein